jgi:crotonobetainyl-CoA:carnitine CoA-transferase CaiB-like acyl-CoA transferase
VGAGHLEHDPRFATNSDRLDHREALDDAIRAIFKDRTVDSVVEDLTAAGVPCGRVRTIDEVLQDPQLAARRMLLDIPIGDESVRVPGNPVKLSGVSDLPQSPPPALGAHTHDVRTASRKRT